MKTYEERTQAVLDMVEKKRRRRRAIVATVSSVVPCLVVLMVTLAVFLPTAGGLSSDKSVEMAADRSSSSPYGESAANAEDVDLYAAKVAASPYRHVLESISKDAPSGYNIKIVASSSDSSGSQSSAGKIVYDGVTTAMSSGLINLSSSSGDYTFNLSSSGTIGADAHVDGEAYIENTNTQVAGVKEGDILKESTHYFYRMSVTNTEEDIREYGANGKKTSYDRRLKLEVFRKNGLDTVCDVSFDFLPFGTEWGTVFLREMFLSDDCKSVYAFVEANIIVSFGEDGDSQRSERKMMVVALDISDLSAIRVKNSIILCGDYMTARMVGGNLLVCTYYCRFYLSNGGQTSDPDDLATFVPYVEVNGEKTFCAPEDIVCPDKVRYYTYRVMTELNADLGLVGQCAVLNGAMNKQSAIYVTPSRAYVATRNPDKTDKVGATTDIVCIEYSASGLHIAGVFEVEGRVDNQYWMDEYEGVLRVVSTVDDKIKISSTDGNNADLTCFAVGTWDIVGQVTRFAPEGESVRSVRYVGNKAYVCTAIVAMRTISDPVYCFDLSDYAHIGVVDTGTIEGFSSTLTPFADDTMLGIGCETASDVKLELYRETDVDVQSVCSLVLGGKLVIDEKGNYYLDKYILNTDYKAYLFNAEEGVIGLPCMYERTKYVWSEDYGLYRRDLSVYETKYLYVLCAYKDGQLRLAETIIPDGTNPAAFRAAIADGYAYVFGKTTLNVVALADLH